MSPGFIRFCAGLVAGALLLAFIVIFVLAIYWTWNTPSPVMSGSEFVWAAGILSGLVGGVVAAIFSVKPPPPAGGPGMATTAGITSTASVWRPSVVFAELKQVLKSLVDHDWLPVLSAVYFFVYLVIGLAAILTLVVKSGETPEVVRNLALVAIGLFIAVARTFFAIPK